LTDLFLLFVCSENPKPDGLGFFAGSIHRAIVAQPIPSWHNSSGQACTGISSLIFKTRETLSIFTNFTAGIPEAREEVSGKNKTLKRKG